MIQGLASQVGEQDVVDSLNVLVRIGAARDERLMMATRLSFAWSRTCAHPLRVLTSPATAAAPIRKSRRHGALLLETA